MPVAITQDGLSIKYEVFGRGDPLLLISGTGHDRTFWSGQVPLLSRYFQCIVFDNRGVGQSSIPEPGYSLSDMAGDVIAVLDVEDIETIHIMGFSMGGHIAQEFALAHADRVLSLGLHHTWARCDERLKYFQTIRRALATAGDLEALINLSFIGLYEPQYFHRHAGELISKKREMVSGITNLDGWIGQLEACINSNTLSRIHEIRVPTIVTCSDRDVIVPPYLAREIHDQISGARLQILEGTGHVALIEKPDVFGELCLDFLNDVIK